MDVCDEILIQPRSQMRHDRSGVCSWTTLEHMHFKPPPEKKEFYTIKFYIIKSKTQIKKKICFILIKSWATLLVWVKETLIYVEKMNEKTKRKCWSVSQSLPSSICGSHLIGSLDIDL